MERIAVIGIGPGGEDYLLPAARKAAAAAEVLIGSQRALDLFRDLEKDKIVLSPPLERVIAYLKKERSSRKIAVLVSGDPGLYSFLDLLAAHFRREELEVIPGISSVQMAFARMSLTWQDAAIFSLHGRNKEEIMQKKVLPAVQERPKVALLTDAEFSPATLARWLLARGIRGKKVVIADSLSYPEEKLVEGSLEEISKQREKFCQCVVLILDE